MKPHRRRSGHLAIGWCIATSITGATSLRQGRILILPEQCAHHTPQIVRNGRHAAGLSLEKRPRKPLTLIDGVLDQDGTVARDIDKFDLTLVGTAVEFTFDRNGLFLRGFWIDDYRCIQATRVESGRWYAR